MDAAKIITRTGAGLRTLFYKTGLIILLLPGFQGCSVQPASVANRKSLQEVFRKDFLIGTALNAGQILEKDAGTSRLISREFNAITPENCMKAANIHPRWNSFDFTLSDKLVEFASKHQMKVNGHTLVWHSQLPRFAQQINAVDSFKNFFETHIQTVAARYRGKVFSWDVVNEALNEDGSLRRSIFWEKLGPDYITEAFRLTAAAAPDAELYYNDYNNEQPKKRAGCIELIKKVQSAGVRIDGVGIQGHWHLGKIPLQDIEESILAYHALGLKVMITELDMEVLPRYVEGADISLQMASEPGFNPYVNGIPDSILQQQAEDYANLFKLLLKHADKVARVTFWGVDDGQSWLNRWPVRGRTNYPLLFDRQLRPKPAYHRITDLKK